MQSYLDFEKPVADLEGKIAELKSLSGDARAVNVDDEINGLTVRADQALADIYRKLTPWQKTQVARHPQRPHFSDYIKSLITEWQPLLGAIPPLSEADWLQAFDKYKQIPRRPSEYMKKLYFDTALGWHKPAFECACALVGIEHIVYGTDYFMEGSTFMDWTNAFLDELDITKGDKQKIYSGNAERFLQM